MPYQLSHQQTGSHILHDRLQVSCRGIYHQVTYTPSISCRLHTQFARGITVQHIGLKHSDNLFLLIDETGKCIIDPDGAEVTPSESDTWYGNSRYPEYGVKASSSFMQSGQFRYSEKRMHVGDHLYAIGHFESVTGERGSLNDDVKAILRQWKEFPDDYLKRFDTNNDGEIDLIEWQEVRRAAEKQAFEERQERIREHGTIHILKQDAYRPFLLSTVPEFDLVRKLRIYAALSLAGFLALGSLSVWLILVRLSA